MTDNPRIDILENEKTTGKRFFLNGPDKKKGLLIGGGNKRKGTVFSMTDAKFPRELFPIKHSY